MYSHVESKVRCRMANGCASKATDAEVSGGQATAILRWRLFVSVTILCRRPRCCESDMEHKLCISLSYCFLLTCCAHFEVSFSTSWGSGHSLRSNSMNRCVFLMLPITGCPTLVSSCPRVHSQLPNISKSMKTLSTYLQR